MSIEQWGGPSHDLLEEVYDILSGEVNEMIDVRFYPYRYGGLHQRVKSVLFSFLVAFGNSPTVHLSQNRC